MFGISRQTAWCRLPWVATSQTSLMQSSFPNVDNDGNGDDYLMTMTEVIVIGMMIIIRLCMYERG